MRVRYETLCGCTREEEHTHAGVAELIEVPLCSDPGTPGKYLGRSRYFKLRRRMRTEDTGEGPKETDVPTVVYREIFTKDGA